MEDIKIIIDNYNIEIILGIIIGYLLLFIIFIIYTYKTNKSIKRYNKLLNGRKDINIEELINEMNNSINNMNNNLSTMEDTVTDITNKLDFAIQRVGFIRYNAFDDIGSQLSFSIALLDEFKNGLIITSIYGRDDNVSYGKEIKDGTSNIPLSAEEMLAIDRAIERKVYG